jgi:ABC-2 type transport system permease protein
VILDLMGVAGYKLYAVAYPVILGTLCGALGYLLFRRGDLP